MAKKSLLQALSDLNDNVQRIQSRELSPDQAIQEITTVLPAMDTIRGLMIPILQNILDVLAGHSCEKYQENADLVRNLNSLRQSFRLAFRLRSDLQCRRVSVRCSNTTRTKSGSFQAVTTTSKQKVLETSTTLPAFEIFDPSNLRRQKR